MTSLATELRMRSRSQCECVGFNEPGLYLTICSSQRKLDDEDLDSGDDVDRTDRVPDATQDVEEGEEQTFNYMDAEIARHPVPEPSDGELYLLKIPRFLAIEPTAFSTKDFQAPTTDHHSKVAPSEHFSAYDTAMTTVRWRRSPSNISQLQSNARLLRWSDGSLTLQFASAPLEQYEIKANMLAPPQIRPKKPTPTSEKHHSGTQYKESYTYLAAPYEAAQVMRVTNKLTTGLAVVPTMTAKDGAVEKLQAELAKAASRGRDEADQAISLINVTEDPELQQKREEAAFKQKQKQAKAAEKQELREREKTTRRHGGRSTGYGLSIGNLEDEEGGRRGGPRKPKAKTGGRRDYDDDDDYGGRGRTKEDEYDEEDDFIVGSDEEEEVVDDDDPDDGIVESPRQRKEKESPKRSRVADDDDDNDVTVSRGKRRRVIEDDDEDE
jgi:RNA polymerase-associated protein LEO1